MANFARPKIKKGKYFKKEKDLFIIDKTFSKECFVRCITNPTKSSFAFSDWLLDPKIWTRLGSNYKIIKRLYLK